jgi:hypothetical protein
MMNLLCFYVPNFANHGAKLVCAYVTYAVMGTL